MRNHWQYLMYVIRHKWFVLTAGLRIGVPLWQLIIHDWSKFTPSEWGPYVRWFQVKDRSPEAKAAFDAAWEHHWVHNPHHWQYWWGGHGRLITPMPDRYVREMIADWSGAGRAITGKWEVAEWYAKNRDTYIFHPVTRHRVEELIAQIT